MARKKKRKAPVNIPICLAIILLFLTLISVRFSGGIVARYTTTTDSGDSARVIEFNNIQLEVTGSDTQYIYPGAVLQWNANVTFAGSESATYVFVEVTGVHAANAESVTPIAGGPSWEVDTNRWSALDADNYPGVYYCALVPNATMVEVPLFKSAAAEIPENITAGQLNNMAEATATFRASVVQSNGFESPEAAWKSLKSKH